MVSGGTAIRLVAAFSCLVLAGCGLPDPPTPTAPSSAAPPGPPIEELRPKLVAALTKAGQPLGAVTTADEDSDPAAPGYSTSIKYCDTLIGGSIGGAIGRIRGRLGQSMTVGTGGEKQPGLRVEAEVVYEARSLSAVAPNDRCSGYLGEAPLRFRTGVVYLPVGGSQVTAGVSVRGRSAAVVRTTLGNLGEDRSFAFLHGQVRLIVRSDPRYLNVAVLKVRPAAPSEVSTLTDEAQQIAIELAERVLAELPP